MSERYSTMSQKELLDEMDAWQSVSDAPRGPGKPSKAAREAAYQQMVLAEAWYYRLEFEAESDVETDHENEPCPSCGRTLAFFGDKFGQGFQCENVDCGEMYDFDEIVEAEQ